MEIYLNFTSKTLFDFQRMDLGECPKVHDLALRADYEQATKTKDYYYDIDVSDFFYVNVMNYRIFPWSLSRIKTHVITSETGVPRETHTHEEEDNQTGEKQHHGHDLFLQTFQHDDIMCMFKHLMKQVVLKMLVVSSLVIHMSSL